jgi:protein disulfide-isomerase A1
VTDGTERITLQLGKSLVHYFVSTQADRDAYLTEMRPLAKKYREYLQFTTIDANEYPEMLGPLGLAPGSTKALSVMNPSNGDVFPYNGEKALSADVVEAFLMDIISGKVEALGKGSSQKSSGRGMENNAGHDEL